MEVENSAITNSYLSFKLGNETFAAHASKVVNILEMCHITEVPKVPDTMKGIINLRGTVLPIIDLRLKLSIESFNDTAANCIIVHDISNGSESVLVGAIVDSVQAVLELDSSEIMAPPSIGNIYRSEFIVGVANIEGNFIMVLDMDAIFSVEEILDVKAGIENVSI